MRSDLTEELGLREGAAHLVHVRVDASSTSPDAAWIQDYARSQSRRLPAGVFLVVADGRILHRFRDGQRLGDGREVTSGVGAWGQLALAMADFWVTVGEALQDYGEGIRRDWLR